MKYLNKFVERSSFVIPDKVREELSDILADLEEEGYKIDYKWNFLKLRNKYFDECANKICISRHLNDRVQYIKYSEILEYIKRISSYLSIEGLKIVVINGNYEQCVPVSADHELSIQFIIKIYKI